MPHWLGRQSLQPSHNMKQNPSKSALQNSIVHTYITQGICRCVRISHIACHNTNSMQCTVHTLHNTCSTHCMHHALCNVYEYICTYINPSKSALQNSIIRTYTTQGISRVDRRLSERHINYSNSQDIAQFAESVKWLPPKRRYVLKSEKVHYL